MENIFENAYFDKPYRTRDGRKAIYIGPTYKNGHALHIDKNGSNFSNDIYNDNGKMVNNKSQADTPYDIVSEWQEEINEEELDEKVNYLIDSLSYWMASEDEPELFAEDFKKLLDLAPKHPRVIEYCDYLIKSANAYFNNKMKTIINKENIK